MANILMRWRDNQAIVDVTLWYLKEHCPQIIVDDQYFQFAYRRDHVTDYIVGKFVFKEDYLLVIFFGDYLTKHTDHFVQENLKLVYADPEYLSKLVEVVSKNYPNLLPITAPDK